MSNNISSKNIKRLMGSHSFFIAAKTFFDIFINVYIWKVSSDLHVVATYWIIYLISHTAFFTIFGKSVKNGHTRFTRKMSVLGYIASALIIMVLQEQTIQHIPLLAILIGFASGTYWITYQVLRFDATHIKNRGNYVGHEKGIKKTIGVLIPILGGSIIAFNYLNTGYGGVFVLSAILFIIAFVLNKAKTNTNTKKFELFKTFKLITKHPDIKKAMFSYMVSGFGRTGSIEKTLIPLLILYTLGSEFQLGSWLSFFSVISAITSVIAGKYIKRRNYKFTIILSGVFLILSMMLLMGIPAFWTVILFAIAREIISLFIMIPKRVISENLIHEIPNYKEYRVEYLILREWAGIGVGRVLSYVILLFVVSLSIQNLKLFFILSIIAVAIELLLLVGIRSKSYRQNLKCTNSTVSD